MPFFLITDILHAIVQLWQLNLNFQIDFGQEIPDISGVELHKRRNHEDDYRDFEFRIGSLDIGTGTGYRITLNRLCGLYSGPNKHRKTTIFCKKVLRGRYLTAQSLIDFIAIDELLILTKI